MLLHDAFRYGEAESCSFSMRLRGEERLEDAGLKILWNSWAVIGQFNPHLRCFVIMHGADRKFAAFLVIDESMLRIPEKIQQHLLYRARVCAYHRHLAKIDVQ